MATYRFALLGDPVGHSRSPEIHRALLALSGNQGEYLAIRADRTRLTDAVADLRDGVWDGLNVTMPLKSDAAELADQVEPGAARSGSVNTLARSGATIRGHSTDAIAFVEVMNRPGFASSPAVLVLGAGGSAAAALASLGRGANVYISARREDRAHELAKRLGGDVAAWGAAVAGSVVINTTPIGMSGETLPPGVLDAASGLIDLPYGTGETPASAQARRRGLPVVDGHEFLLRQAIASFHLWTGTDVEFEEAVHALRKA